MKLNRQQLRKIILLEMRKYGSEEHARDARAGGYDPDRPIPAKYWQGTDNREDMKPVPAPDIVKDYNPLQSRMNMLRRKFKNTPDALQYLELGFEMIMNVSPGLDPSDNKSIHVLAQQVARATGFSKMMLLPIIRLASNRN